MKILCWKSNWNPYRGTFDPPEPNVVYLAVSECGSIHGFGDTPDKACDMVRYRIKAEINRLTDGTLNNYPDLKAKAEWLAGLVDGEAAYIYMEAKQIRRVESHEK